MKDFTPIREKPIREPLPPERTAITHKVRVGGHKIYVTAGFYDDGRLGEIFLTMNKEGSTTSGFASAWATAVSRQLQYGIPLREVLDSHAHQRFEPMGLAIGIPEINEASSIVDYVARWLLLRFEKPAKLQSPRDSRVPTAAPDPSRGVEDSSGPPPLETGAADSVVRKIVEGSSR